MAQSNFIILNDVPIHVVDGVTIKVRFILIVCFLSISILILDNDIDDNTLFERSSIESPKSYRPASGVSVALIKMERARRQEGNLWIKSPTRSIDKVEHNPMIGRYQKTRAKTGIHVTRVPLKRSFIRYKSSIVDHRPSEAVSTINLDDYNEVESTSNSLSINRMNTPISSERSIPLDEIELSRLLRRSTLSSNRNRTSAPSKRKKSRRKKLSKSKSAVSPQTH